MNTEIQKQDWILPDAEKPKESHPLTAFGSKDLRVLHLTTPGQCVEADRVVLQGARALRDIGIKTTLGILSNPNHPEDFELYIDQARMRNIPVKILHGHQDLDGQLLNDLQRYLRSEQMNVLHSHGSRALAYSLLTHHPKLSLATTLHQSYLDELRQQKQNELIERLAMRHLDRIFVETLDHQAYLLTQRISATRVALVENMLDDQRERLPLTTAFPSEGPLRLLYVGTLRHDCGLDNLLNAVNQLRERQDVRLDVIGNGPALAEFTLATREMKLSEHVHFWRSEADYHQFVRQCHILVLPMKQIGLPLSMIEAVACAKPVVASRRGGVSQLVEHDFNGLLTPNADSENLFHSIQTISGNYDVFHKNAFLASQRVLQRYSARRWARTLEVHYSYMRAG